MTRGTSLSFSLSSSLSSSLRTGGKSVGGDK